MIELNKKTQQDFLSREWVQKLLDAGVDMNDAKYFIVTKQTSILIREGKKPKAFKADFIITKAHYEGCAQTQREMVYENVMPTYTTAELLYKLHEWIYPTIDGVEYSGGIGFVKDAPFYIFYYDVEPRESKDGDNKTREYMSASFEYPIESLAGVLIQCMKKGIGCVKDISDK